MESDVRDEGGIWIQSVLFTMCLLYCVSTPPFSEAGCTWQLSRAPPVPLEQLCCRMWHFLHLLAAELTRNWGNINVLAVSVLPAGNRKWKCWNFTVNGAFKSIMSCSDKTRILVLAETRMKALNKLMQSFIMPTAYKPTRDVNRVILTW